MENPDWLKELSPKKRAEAQTKIDMMQELGATDAEEWIQSEMQENIPQLARYLVLRRIWPELIDFFSDPLVIKSLADKAEKTSNDAFGDAGISVKRMLEAGVAVSDLASFARYIAYQTAFGILEIIDEGYDSEASEEAPKWSLRETNQDDKLTGRQIDDLHESILSLDPSGREGKPEL